MTRTEHYTIDQQFKRYPRLTLPCHKSNIHSIRWNPEGNLLASGGADKTIHLHRVAEAELIFEQRYFNNGHTNEIDQLCWNPALVESSYVKLCAGEELQCVHGIQPDPEASQKSNASPLGASIRWRGRSRARARVVQHPAMFISQTTLGTFMQKEQTLLDNKLCSLIPVPGHDDRSELCPLISTGRSSCSASKPRPADKIILLLLGMPPGDVMLGVVWGDLCSVVRRGPKLSRERIPQTVYAFPAHQREETPRLKRLLQLVSPNGLTSMRCLSSPACESSPPVESLLGRLRESHLQVAPPVDCNEPARGVTFASTTRQLQQTSLHKTICPNGFSHIQGSTPTSCP